MSNTMLVILIFYRPSSSVCYFTPAPLTLAPGFSPTPAAAPSPIARSLHPPADRLHRVPAGSARGQRHPLHFRGAFPAVPVIEDGEFLRQPADITPPLRVVRQRRAAETAVGNGDRFGHAPPSKARTTRRSRSCGSSIFSARSSASSGDSAAMI